MRVVQTLSLFSCLLLTLQAHDVKDIESRIESEDQETYAETLRAIVLAPPKATLPNEIDREGVTVVELNLSEEEVGRLQDRLKPLYWDRPITSKVISDLKKEVIIFYQSIHRPVVLVQIPEQELSNQVLLMNVLESSLGEVTVSGNKYFSKERYLNAIRLKKGTPIRSDKLAADLAWINRSPYKTVDAIYAPGKSNGTTDINLVVQDRYPWRVYAGADNTGFKDIEYNRLFAGFMLGNFLNADQQFSYQFTTALNPRKFMAYSVSWSMPLPWRHIFTLYGGYSSLHAKVPQIKTMKSNGIAGQASARYEIPFLPRNPLIDSLSIGADYKRTNNTVDFGGSTIANQSVNIFEFALEYSLTHEWDNLRTFVKVDLFGQPGPMIPDMSDRLYRRLRPYAKNSFIYGLADIHNLYRIPSLSKDSAIENRLVLQLSSTNLLASEQYGLGGYNTVRGYTERAINVDNAFLVTTNFYTPGYSFCKPSFNDRLVGLVFVDYGLGWQHHQTFFDFKKFYNLLGIGPGLRYHMNHWLTVRLDWGVKIFKLERDAPRTRLHFSIIGAY
jgi:hemolysin activation/secretion protein